MRSSIRIPARSLWRNSQRRRRIPSSTAAALSSAHLLPSSTTLFVQEIPLSRYFSTHQIETDVPTHSLPQSDGDSDVKAALTEASEAIKRLCQSNAPEQAVEILRAMEKQDLLPPPDDYLKVLRCFIDLDQLDEAHSLLLTMKQTPCEACFPLIATALIAQNMLSKAKQLLYNHMDRGIATTMCFNTVISAYVRQNRRRQAVALTHKMDWYARKGHDKAKPDKMTITSIMQKLASRGHSRDAQALLERMWTSEDKTMQPDAVTYSLVFNAYANAKTKDPDGAYTLLQAMEERYKKHGDLAIRPNTVVYNTFLLVLANAGDGERAELVLKEMETSPDLRPDAISYGTVLTAWKNASRGDEAEALLWRTPNPDRTCFSITISALAKEGKAKRAEAIMQHMISQNIQPNTGTYTAVLNAWANAKDDPDAFENAKRVLQEMGQRKDIVLDTAVYNTFLKAIEHCWMLDNKMNAVRSVLLRMIRSKDEVSQPNSATYRQAIHAVAATQGSAQLQQKALQFALQIYKDHKSLPGPQQIDLKIHSTMLEACGKLSPHGLNGDEIAEQVFATCCQLGIVTSLHTRLLEKAASDTLLKKIFKTDTVDQRMFHSIPKAWSRKRRKRDKVKRVDANVKI